MLIIAYIYLRNVIRISHPVHAYKTQIVSDNHNSFDRHHNFVHTASTTHAIQELLYYRNVYFERRSLLLIPWCRYTVSLCEVADI